jgi:hypothetical protein
VTAEQRAVAGGVEAPSEVLEALPASAQDPWEQ